MVIVDAKRHGTKSRVVPRFARFLALSVALTLAACSDEADNEGRKTAPSAAAAYDVAWLDVSSPISPAQWLVSKGEAKPRALKDPETQRVEVDLKIANQRYRESKRMIANRAMQLSEMLGQIGITESPVDILHDLTGLGLETGESEGFGALSQQYFNLRASQLSRNEALAALKTRYGSKS